MFTRFFEVRVLRALKGVLEGPNSSEILMRTISVPNFGILTFILKKILCSQDAEVNANADANTD